MANNTADLDWIDCHDLRRDEEARGHRRGESGGDVNRRESSDSWSRILRLIEPDGTEAVVPTGAISAVSGPIPADGLDLWQSQTEIDAAERAKAEEQARADAIAAAKAEANRAAKAKAEAAAQEKLRREAAAEEEAQARAEEAAKVEAAAKAEAEARAKAAAAEKAAAAAKAQAEAQAQAQAEAKAAAERKARQEAAAKAKADAEAAEQARLKAAAKAEAEEQAKREAEAKAKAEREAKAAAKAEADAKAKAEAHAKALARAEARALAKAEAEEKARLAQEARTLARADAKAAAEAKARARAEAEAQEKARIEAARKARREAEAKKEAEAKREAEARREAERQAAAAAKAAAAVKAEADRKAKAEAEAKAKAAAEAKAKEEAEAKAKLKAQAEADAKAKAEQEAKAKADAAARKAAEADAKAKAEAEARAKAAQEAKTQQDAETKAKEAAAAATKHAAQEAKAPEPKPKQKKTAAPAPAPSAPPAAPPAPADLGATFRRLIRQTGPISLTHFMAESNARYYTSRDPLGEDGDFITAPEVSQMFGELIGLWFADLWVRMGARKRIHYVELGPGRGTLASDALRTAARYDLAPQIHFVETSHALRQIQRDMFPDAIHHDDLSTLPTDAPLLIVANEFFDALPIHQLVRSAQGWHERMVGLEGDELAFVAGDMPMDTIVPKSWKSAAQGTMIETSPAAVAVMSEIAQRLTDQGGAALVIDYGALELRAGSTLQAIKAHEKVDVLTHPGEADLTAHVDFELLGDIAANNGAEVMGLQMQGEWLRQMGIDTRHEALARKNPAEAEKLARQYDRLMQDSQMGLLFKVLGICGRRWPIGVGFD